jgi:Ca2+-binding RTX toxin-like protein
MGPAVPTEGATMSRATVPSLLIAGTAVLATVFFGAVHANAASTVGTVSVSGNTATFQAGSGASNDLDVATTGDHVFSLIDHGAPLQLAASARSRCVLDSISLRCNGITSVIVNMGDRNDKLHAEGSTRLTASGGSGNDRLEAATYDVAVTFRGNSGNDVLIGGRAGDRLDAGSGNNQRIEGNGGRDTCTGSNVVKVSCEA